MQNNIGGSARARLGLVNARGAVWRRLSLFAGLLLLAGSAAAQKNQPPVVSLTSPTAGAQFTAPANITLAANASDPNGTISRVRFYRGSTLLGTDTTAPYTFNWNNVAAGTYSITARATDNANATTTSAAVSVTVVTTPNQPPTVSLSSPANGSSFTAPASVSLAATAADANGTVSSVAFYNGSTLLGTDTTAPYTFNWTNVAAGTYSITARATDNASATTTSAAVSITVTPPNQAPVLTVNSPTNNQNFDAPATIQFAISASDTGGSIARVDVIEGGANVVASLTSAPYNHTWSGVPVGTKSIVVRAVDNLGAITERALTLNVLAPNQLPSASLTAPAPGTPLYAPASIPLSATALDADGTIASVAFYNGTTLLGTDTTAPYSYNWTNVAAGSYTLAARVTDNRGGVSSSAPVALTVLPAQTNPVVSLTAPADGTEFLAPAQFTVSAAAYGGAGTVSKVDFYRGSNLILSDTTAPYSFTFTASSVGSYEIYAKVTNSRGVAANSAPVRFTVVNNRTPLVQLTAPTAGAGFTAPAAITLQAQASDVDGTIASVSFFNGESLIGTVASAPYTYAWTNVPAGSYLLKARATDNAGVTGVSAATPVTVAVDPNSPDPRITLTAPASGSSFTAPATIELTADALASAGRSITSVAFYSNGTLLAQVGAAPYRFSWTNVPMGNYALMARVTDNLGVSTTSVTTNVSVVASTTQPSVVLTAPQANAQYLEPASLPVTALASGGAGTVSKVEFYIGSQLIRSDTSSPYTFTLTASGEGSRSIYAKVTNSLGETATSAPVSFDVVDNLPPTIAISSPAVGAVHGAGNPLPLAVNASDTGGSVARVDYFIGSRRIAISTASPFSAVWAQPEPGYHQITAVATDDDGATGRSAPVGITITDATAHATAVITSPANGAQLEHSGSVGVTAQASHPTRQIAAVAFYAGQTLIGTDNAAPYYLNWVGAPVGEHVLTVRATDSAGETVTSAPVTVRVMPAKPRLKLVSPRMREILLNTAPVTISMDLYDPGASVQRVVYKAYDGETLGVTTAAPHTLTLSNLTEATHAIWAIAYDALDRVVAEERAIFSLMSPSQLTDSPMVRFVSPQYGELVMGPSVKLAASAMGALGHASVTRVEFHNVTNSGSPVLLGAATSYPFEVTWNNAPKGVSYLRVTAYFDNGQTQTDEVSVQVHSPTEPPYVDLAYPEHGQAFPQGEDVAMNVWVEYPTDHLLRVDYYVNDQLVASLPRSNTDMGFQHILRNYPAGEYFLRAEAIGINGLVGYSEGRRGFTGFAYPPANMISIGDIACRPRIANHVPGVKYRSPHLQGGLQTLDLLVQADPCMGDVIRLGSGFNSIAFQPIPGPLPATLTSGNLVNQSLQHDMPFKVWVERQNGTVRWSDQISLSFVNEVLVGVNGLTEGATYKATEPLQITADVEDCSDCTTRVDFYAGQTLIGSDSTAPYAMSWSGAPVGTHAITARAVDKYGQSVSSTHAVTIQINQPPQVSIVQPTSPALVSTPNALQITANASDDDGIYYVQFLYEYNNSGQLQELGLDFQAPYSTYWGAIPAGSYRFVARAYDNRWLFTDSAPLLVTVASNQAPVVSLLSPANGASFDDPASITITANASDVDGNVVSVAFYADGNLLHSDTAAPFTHTWGGVAAGSYTLTAVATDNRGISSTTAPVSVLVRDNAVDSVTYIHTDISGSPLAATGANGNVVWKENYLAYGQRRLVQPGSERQAQWFHGKEQDTATGLQYFGARYYDPVIGRFLGIDPLDFQEENLHSFNRYAYGNNNPVKYLDPDGNNAVTAFGGLLTEGYNFLTGRGFDGGMVWGALKDGYNGEGAGFWSSAGEDALSFGAGALGGVAKGVQLLRGGRAANETTRVGRWMSQAEHDAMRTSGRVQESFTGTTHVASPADAAAFINQAKPGSLYVEFNVPTSSLKATNQGWSKVIGPKSLEGRAAARKGQPIPQMPAATDITHSATRIP
jgi:RHS repeat-associated protein